MENISFQLTTILYSFHNYKNACFIMEFNIVLHMVNRCSHFFFLFNFVQYEKLQPNSPLLA